MTIEQILELGKMGYSKEDIEALDKVPQDPKQEDPKKEEPKKDDPKQEDPKKDDPKKEEPKKEDPKQEPDKLGKVFDAIAELTKAIQANNITKSQNPQNEVKSAEVLLAEVIRPPRKEK